MTMSLKKLQKAHAEYGRRMGGRRYEDVKLTDAYRPVREAAKSAGKSLKYCAALMAP